MGTGKWSLCGYYWNYDRLDAASIQCRVLLFGDSGVGKTSILEAYGTQPVSDMVGIHFYNF